MITVKGNGATMLLGVGEKTLEVEQYDTVAARELLACLPQTISTSRWGNAFCIFFGPTTRQRRRQVPRSLAVRPSGEDQGERDDHLR